MPNNSVKHMGNSSSDFKEQKVVKCCVQCVKNNRKDKYCIEFLGSEYFYDKKLGEYITNDILSPGNIHCNAVKLMYKCDKNHLFFCCVRRISYENFKEQYEFPTGKNNINNVANAEVISVEPIEPIEPIKSVEPSAPSAPSAPINSK